MKEGATAIFRLFRIELRKVFKGKAIYIILLVLLFFAAIGTSGQADNYSREVSYIKQDMKQTISNLEQGGFGGPVGPGIFIGPSPFSSSGNSPPSIDPSRQLRDEAGALIPENIAYYIELYTNFYEGEIAALTAEGGRYSLAVIMGNGATQTAMLIPLLAVALSVGLFAGEYRNGAYRLMISRGVKRSNLVSAKMATLLLLALVLAATFTTTLLLGGLAAVNGMNTDTSVDISLATVWGIFWVALLMLIAYMLVGGIVSTILASPGSGMAVGLVLAFISATFFFMLTPKDDFFLAAVSPVTLGYNFNSLMYYVWRAGEAADRYRDVMPSIAVVLVFASFYIMAVYSVFTRRDLKS
jgi:ABC-type transport system involved in multi-copper enzyme maturation permease subunit